MCESTMKYFSPLCSYKAPPWDNRSKRKTAISVRTRAAPGCLERRSRARSSPLRPGGQVEAEVVGRVFRVGEHDRLVVEVDHPAVVRRHVLLELGRVEVPRLIA